MMEIRIVTCHDGVQALRGQWEDLWLRADGDYVQSFTACLSAWTHVVAPKGATMLVATASIDGALVALWPCAVRRRTLWRVLYQISPLSADFSDILVEPGLPTSVSAALWKAVAASGHADIASLPLVRSATALASVLSSSNHAAETQSNSAPHLSWRDGETWDTYHRSLSASYRKVQKKKRRQLSKLGTVTFELVRDARRLPELIAWLLQQKRVWSERVGKRGAWLFSPEYEKFLNGLPANQVAGHEFVMFLLTLDGRPVAAQFALIGPRHIDWIIAGFSDEFAHYSPGMLLSEQCVEFALARRLDIELGVGNDDSKRMWTRKVADPTLNYCVALTRWGSLGCQVRSAAARLRDSKLAVSLRRSKPSWTPRLEGSYSPPSSAS